VRHFLARAHIWLGWIIGVPLLFWTASGLFMVLQPIETVRGEHLKRAPVPLILTAPVVAPATGLRAVKSMALEARSDGAKWVISYADGGGRLADPATGELLPRIDAETGAVLATRTKFWRAYDFMWGLHIMDLQTREETSHPILIAFAALAGVGVIIGLILLPLRRRS
jgi:hypothetical protein